MTEMINKNGRLPSEVLNSFHIQNLESPLRSD